MIALRGIASKLALVVLAAATTVACSSENKTLLLVNVSLPATSSVVIDSVSLSVTGAGVTDFPWSKAKAGTLQAGIFLPDSMAGDVTVTAVGKLGGSPLLQGSQTGSVLAGKTNGPITVTLTPISTGDAGSPEIGPAADTAAADLADHDLAPTVPDGGASDVRLDANRAESIAVDGDSDVADGKGLDVPLASDAGADVPVGDVVDSDGDVVEAGPEKSDGSPGEVAAEVGGRDAPLSLNWQPASNVENDILARSYEPSIAVEPITENVYIVWVESTAVKVKRWDRQAGTWGTTRVLQTGGDPNDVQVGTDANGHIMVAWYQDSRVADTTLPGVWVSQSNDGTAWSPPQRLVDWAVYGLQFAMARNGTARMVMSHQPGPNQMVLNTGYYNGSSWTVNPDPVLPVDSPMVSKYGYDPAPQLAVGATGDGILVFDAYEVNDAGSSPVGVAAVNLTGATRSAPQILDTDTVNTVYNTERFAAMNGNGEGVVAWAQYDDSVNLSVYKPSVGWSTPQKLVNTTGASNMAVAMDDQGFITAAWAQSLSVNGYNVVAIHGKVGGKWSEVTPLETDDKSEWTLTTRFPAPRLVANPAGTVLALWKKQVNTTTFGAYARRLEGDTWLPQVKLGEKTDLTAYLYLSSNPLAIADSGFGAATFTFVDPTGATSDPEAYNVEVAFCR